MLMQTQANLSDEAALQCSAYDLRWAAVLNTTAGEPLCARSTLEIFRGQFIIHEEVQMILKASIEEAKRCGLLKKGQQLRTAIDTKPMNGRGAVEDVFNLLATGIVQLGRAIAKSDGAQSHDWLVAHGLGSYADQSIKGSVSIDWSDPAAREQFLASIVKDARRLLDLADGSKPAVKEAGTLLEQLLLQDIKESTSDEGTPKAAVKQGTAPGRIPSATDPEQRHGRKSKSKKFTGQKNSIAVDIDSKIITATDILPGDASDAVNTLEMVTQSQSNTGLSVTETLGDCVYGSGENRQAFADADRKLFAKVPRETQRGDFFPKSAFIINLLENTVSCPAGKTTGKFAKDGTGAKVFSFGKHCLQCLLKSQCTNASAGRSLHVHPQEQLIKEAREYQRSTEGQAHLRERLIVENRLGRLAQLGVRQAKYFGLAKSRFQLSLAAAVANFRLTWNWQQLQAAG
jgi:hypothetical protein